MAAPAFVPITDDLIIKEVEPFLVSTLFSFMFFGVGLLQFWSLFRRLNRDPDTNWTKDIVVLGVLLFFDLVDSGGKAAFLIIWLNHLLQGGMARSVQLPTVVVLPCIMDGLLATCVHAIYARRLYRIIPERRGTVTVITLVMGISLTQFVASAVSSHIAQRPLSEWYPQIRIASSLWFGGAALADILLCGMMVFHLQRHRRLATFEQTNSLITRFVVLTFETMMIPAVLQIIELVLFLALPNSHLHFSIALCQPKLYLNGVLILLQTALSTRSNSGMRYTGSLNGSLNRNHEINLQSSTNSQSGDLQFKLDGLRKGHARSPASGVIVESQIHTVNDISTYPEEKRWPLVKGEVPETGYPESQTRKSESGPES